MDDFGDYNAVPPPGGEPFLSEPPPGGVQFAKLIRQQMYADNAVQPLLELLVAHVAASPNASAGVLKLLVERVLPPAPSRAEAWWEKNLGELREMGYGFRENSSLADISRWLADSVKAGRLSPAIAAELVGHFKVLHAAGGFTTPKQIAPDLKLIAKQKGV